MVRLSRSRTRLAERVPVEQALPFIGDQLHRHDRFGGGVMQIVGLEAEHVARRVEGADLAPPSGSSLQILTTPDTTL